MRNAEYPNLFHPGKAAGLPMILCLSPISEHTGLMKTAHLQIVECSTTAAAVPIQPASWDIWDQKYRLKAKDGRVIDSAIDDTYQRVAKAIAAVETTHELRQYWCERFLWALRHGAIPAGRIISNAGAWDHKPATSTINCTVSGVIKDSMDDILSWIRIGIVKVFFMREIAVLVHDVQ